jgi:hypothetical protein
MEKRWTYSLTAWVIPILWWIGWMNNHWLSRPYKITWLIFCSVELAVWLLTLGVCFWWMLSRNEPTFPDDPANSFKACCTPEFYNTVPSCPNYNHPMPECNPGININELGTNWPIVFFFVVIIIMIIIYMLYLWLSFQILWETDGLIQYGDPDAPIEALRFPAASTGGSTGGGTAFAQTPPQLYQLVPQSAPSSSGDTTNSLLTSNASLRNVLKARK